MNLIINPINMKLKYVLTRNNDFAIFSSLSNHIDISKQLFGTPISAGFCKLLPNTKNNTININCYGKSISLNLQSRIIDSQIINDLINNPNY